jgi:hypothetical protein
VDTGPSPAPAASAPASPALPGASGTGSSPAPGASTNGETGASGEAASAPAPARRRRRHRGLARARGPLLSLGWRYTSIPTEGAGGDTHTAQLTFQPFARERTLFRAVIGAEIALRAAPHDHLDAIAWLIVGVGAHLPGRLITPYATAVFYGGFATRSRFLQTIAESAWMLGGEVGADLRIVGFFGLGIAAGIGRTVVGDQYSVAGWFRASVALF